MLSRHHPANLDLACLLRPIRQPCELLCEADGLEEAGDRWIRRVRAAVAARKRRLDDSGHAQGGR